MRDVKSLTEVSYLPHYLTACLSPCLHIYLPDCPSIIHHTCLFFAPQSDSSQCSELMTCTLRSWCRPAIHQEPVTYSKLQLDVQSVSCYSTSFSFPSSPPCPSVCLSLICPSCSPSPPRSSLLLLLPCLLPHHSLTSHITSSPASTCMIWMYLPLKGAGRGGWVIVINLTPGCAEFGVFLWGVTRPSNINAVHILHSHSWWSRCWKVLC